MKWKQLFYPPRCPFCGRINKTGHPCGNCLKHTTELTGEVCRKCGSLPELCKCTERSFSFVRSISAFTYEGGPRTLLLRFKERNAPQLAVFMAGRMFHHIRGRYQENFSAISYVPQTRKSGFRRGYCPAKLLAERLAEQLDLPLVDALTRIGGKQQKYLTGNERWQNAKNNYQAQKEGSLYGKVLLIDDHFTTGATLNSCAALLKELGAEEVFCATFTITVKKS